MITLTSDRLRVELPEPGEKPNDRTRFTRAGFISNVILDGTHHFCASEPRNLIHPSSGGRGLCCEYKADYSGEVPEGEWYPKLGVGLIQKQGPYDFSATYKDVKPFSVSVNQEASRCTFVTEPKECLGYSVREERTISVSGCQVEMTCTLENTGSRTIETQEYCHNFLSIDGMAISPDYILTLPGLNLPEGRIDNLYPTVCNFLGDAEGVKLERADLAVSLSQLPMEQFDGRKPFHWALRHKGAGLTVTGRDDVTVTAITLWAVDHMISPELLQTITLAPGQKIRWTRSWTFTYE